MSREPEKTDTSDEASVDQGQPGNSEEASTNQIESVLSENARSKLVRLVESDSEIQHAKVADLWTELEQADSPKAYSEVIEEIERVESEQQQIKYKETSKAASDIAFFGLEIALGVLTILLYSISVGLFIMNQPIVASGFSTTASMLLATVTILEIVRDGIGEFFPLGWLS